jgi:hypothetical protein
MSRALFTKLPPFNSVFDEARVASTPTAVLKSVAASSAAFASGAASGVIYWNTISSNTLALTLSNQAYGAGAGLLGSPVGTLSLIDTTLYNPQSVVEVDRTTLSALRNSRFTVLQDGVYRISGRVNLDLALSAGSISSGASGTVQGSVTVFLLRDDNVTITEMNRITIPTPGYLSNGATVVVPWDAVRPFASGTVLNIGYSVFGVNAASAAVGSITIEAAAEATGAECHITREVTLVHAVPQ